MTDKEFETLTYNLILNSVSPPEGVRVEFVDRRPQRGKDIIILSDRNVVLFGIPICCRSTAGLKIYVECKMTDSDNALSFERIAANAAQNREGCDTFVVFTNGTFTVGALWNLVKLFQGTGTQLRVVDGYRLVELLAEANLSKRPSLPLPFAAPTEEIVNGVQYRMTVNRFDVGHSLQAEITIILQNMTSEARSCRLFLQSDCDWEVVELGPELLFHLQPYGLDGVRLSAKREIADSKATIRLGLDVGSSLHSISRQISGLSRLDFRPDFLGKGHVDAAEILSTALRDCQMSGTNFLLASVLGPAGTGKSRLVEEVAFRLNGTTYCWNWFEFGSSSSSLMSFVERANRHGVSINVPANGCVATMLRSFAASTVGFGKQIPVLVLENLHNADEESCLTLLDFLLNTVKRSTPIVFIVTGRSDYSHGNPHFQRLADIIAGRTNTASECHIRLEPFQPEECSSFITNIIQDVPPEVVDTLQSLSANTPGNIVQCVEWLLDMNVVRIAYRSSVGIIDHRRFGAHFKSLPGSMTALLADRFDLLRDEPDGEKAQEVLLAAALLGADPPSDLLNLFGSFYAESVRKLLIGRRFLLWAEDEVHLQWHHENLLLHFRNWLLHTGLQPQSRTWKIRNKESWQKWATRGEAAATAVSRRLCGCDELLEPLGSLDRGLVASLAGDHEHALAYWKGMLDDVACVDGYSTADIDASYFMYLRFAFVSVEVIERQVALLPSILKAMTYIGGYSLSLADGERAAEFGISKLARAGSDMEADLFWLRCLRAHFLLDAGQVRLSQGLLLELQADYLSSPALRGDLRLGFEVYNCLGMLYGYLNHADLALRCFGLANLHATRLDDPKLKGKQVADRSTLYQFQDFAHWEELVLEAARLNNSGGSVRHKRHADLSLLSYELVKSCSNGNFRKVSEELDELHRDCKAAGYFSVMPRLYLMRAAINLLLATDGFTARQHDERMIEAADRAAEHGLGIGAVCGVGFASWQLLNLRAMIAARRGQWKEALQRLMSAFQVMHNDGLLFLGHGDLACPNQVVLANLVKLLHGQHSDHAIKNVLRSVRTYQTEDYSQEDEFEYAVTTSLKHHAILARQPVSCGLPIDEKTGLQFGLVVWV